MKRQPEYNPTRKQIAEAAARVREGWDEHRWARAIGRQEAYRVPEVRVHLTREVVRRAEAGE